MDAVTQREEDLRRQLDTYADKFNQVQEAINKSNQVFGTFKQEMEQVLYSLFFLFIIFFLLFFSFFFGLAIPLDSTSFLIVIVFLMRNEPCSDDQEAPKT